MTRAEELATIIAENKRRLRELEAELKAERDAAALEASPWKLGDVLEQVKVIKGGRPLSISWVLDMVQDVGGRTLLIGRRVRRDGSIGKSRPQYIWGEVRKVGHMSPETTGKEAQ